MSRFSIALGCALTCAAAAACGNGGDAGTDAGPTPSPPKFLDLTVSPKTLTDFALVNVEATVIDDDGDLASGRLETSAGASIGLFTQVSDSGFVLALSWRALHDAEPIEFNGVSAMRTLYARFIDRAEHATRMPIELGLECASGGACGGTCKDLSSDSRNCGACGHVCDGECKYGRCPPTLSECVATAEMMTCDEVCAAQGGTCFPSELCAELGPQSTVGYYASAELCERRRDAHGAFAACARMMGTALGSHARCCCRF